MIRLFLLLMLTIVGIWSAAYTLETKGPGYVWLSYDNYSIETTFWVFVALILVIIAIIYAVIICLKLAIRGLKHIGFLSKNWGVSKSEQFITQFRIAYADELWSEASEAFNKGAKKSALMPADRIMAVRSALRSGRVEQARNQFIQLQTVSDLSELSLRLLDIDIVKLEHNQPNLLKLHRQLINDYPRNHQVQSLALSFFIQQELFEDAFAVYKSLTRKQQKQYKVDFASVEVLKIKQASNIDELKPYLKNIHKQQVDLQVSILEKAQLLDTNLACKALLQAVKHQQLSVLKTLSLFSLNEVQALELIKHIDGMLNAEDHAGLSGDMLAGLAHLNVMAKLNNKALDIYQHSLSVETNMSVLNQYINLLNQNKTAEQMRSAMLNLSEQTAC